MARAEAVEDEAALIRRAKSGDPSAFAEIYDRCQPAVYRYLLYRLHDEALAEDLTSAVFVRLVEKIEGFRYRGRPILAWLYTVARNLMHDHHRRAGRTSDTSLDEDPAATLADPGWTAEASLTWETLTDAMGSLTEEQQQVVLLKFVEGYDNHEVARLMRKSVGAVKSLQHRALAALRRVLGEESR